MKRRLIVILAVLALVLAACGSDTTGEPDAAATTATATDAATETAGEQSLAIVSLSPVATEMLFAIGAADQVVAVDSLSTYPDGTPVTDLSGFQPNVEAVATYEPDLVIMTPHDEAAIAGIEALGATVITQDAAADLDGVYAQIAELGDVTGHEEEAAELIAQMQADIDAILATVPDRAVPLTYYHELDDTLFSVTSNTFVGAMYTLAGLENVADPAESASGPYPQLSEEFLLDADPDVIFLADTLCCGQDAATAMARPGWDNLTAVRNGQIVELDDDVASRWGPRVVEFLEYGIPYRLPSLDPPDPRPRAMTFQSLVQSDDLEVDETLKAIFYTAYDAKTFVILKFGGSLVAFGIGMFLLNSIVFGIFLAIIVYLIPGVLLTRIVKARAEKLEQQTSDVMLALGSTIKSGMTLEESITEVATTMRPPVSEEFSLITARI